MPELPEVEMMARSLNARVRGTTITRAALCNTRKAFRILRECGNGARFFKKIEGKKIITVTRAGKNILFELSDGTRVGFHPMMTGKVLINPPNPTPHDRAVFECSSKLQLVFHDIRTFSRFRFFDKGIFYENDALTLSYKKFWQLVSGSKGKIKPLLMNQQKIVGIGNIYADEILWYAGVKPTRISASLDRKEIKKIYITIRRVLEKAIAAKGTTSKNYQMPDGTQGGYYKMRRAYRRTGEQCGRDKGIITRVVLGQRSAHFCPVHQR